MVVCKVCNEYQSNFLPQRTIKQLMWGGWTCPYCGAEYNRKGKLTKKNEKKLKEYKKSLFEKEYLLEKARLKAQKEYKKK